VLRRLTLFLWYATNINEARIRYWYFMFLSLTNVKFSKRDLNWKKKWKKNEGGWYKNERFTLGPQSKIKDLLCTVSLWELFRKIYINSGKHSNLKLDKCTLFKQKKKNILFYVALFLIHICVKNCYLKISSMDCSNKMKNKWKNKDPGSVVQLVVNTNTVLNLLNHMIKSNHIICLLLNMSLKLIIWLKCSKTKTPLIPVLNLNHLITKKYLPPSTRKRNAQRLNQWKAKRIEAVVYTKVNTEAQTENRNTQIDETTQTDQQSNHDQIHGRIQDYKLGGRI
jgi:hypothetical protein